VSSTPQLIGLIIKVSGILDHPLEPVIGLAAGETRWRVTTTEYVFTFPRRVRPGFADFLSL